MQNNKPDRNEPAYYKMRSNMKPNPFWKRISLAQYGVIKRALFIFLYIFTALLAEPRQSDHMKAQLISEVKSIQPGKPFCVALRLKMDEHWHTYWKNPGDSGLPTKIEWNLPNGFVSGDIQWPYPQRFETSQDVSFGYEGEVFLITQIKAPRTIISGTKVKLSASVDWLVCKDKCIVGHADLMLELPVKSEKPKVNTRWADYFKETRKKLPKAPSDWKISASIKKNQILIYVKLPSWFKGELKNITFFPEEIGFINYSASQNLKRIRDGYILEVQRSQLSTELPARLKGIFFSPEGWSNHQEEHALSVDVPLMNIK